MLCSHQNVGHEILLDHGPLNIALELRKYPLKEYIFELNYISTIVYILIDGIIDHYKDIIIS